MSEYRILQVGDHAPCFEQNSTSNHRYHFDTAGGRYLVLCFFLNAEHEQGENMLKIINEQRSLFDDDHIAFFGVSISSDDKIQGKVRQMMPGIRFFWDFDYKISQLYGVLPGGVKKGDLVSARRLWFVLNPNFQIRAIFPVQSDGNDRHQVADYLKALPPVNSFMGFTVQAPIIILPNVFEKQLCDYLIQYYETHGGEESGFMREENGKTVGVYDYGHKSRSDCTIDNENLKQVLQHKVQQRIVPEIKKVHQFHVTRMERYIVACYESEKGGHFRPHRDNTTKGTVHRKFALSINLNNDFDGGEVSFPEYGSTSYKASIGGAVVFSCSLLHAVSRVTRGKRYVFLPFLYDEAAASMREQNNCFLDENVGQYLLSK